MTKSPLMFYNRFILKSIPCLHVMACPQVLNGGGDLRVHKVASDILNRSHGELTRGDHPLWWLGWGLKTPLHKSPASYEMLHWSSDLVGMTQAMENGHEFWILECWESL